MAVSCIVGFGSEKLVPAFVHSFLLILIELHHYEQRSDFVASIFTGQGRVGSHTDVYILQESRFRRFSWSHPGRCPFSQPLPIFCPKCYVYMPWKHPYVSPDEAKVTNICRHCGHLRVTVKDALLKRWTRGKVLSQDAEGDWFVTELSIGEETPPS